MNSSSNLPTIHPNTLVDLPTLPSVEHGQLTDFKEIQADYFYKWYAIPDNLDPATRRLAMILPTIKLTNQLTMLNHTHCYNITRGQARGASLLFLRSPVKKYKLKTNLPEGVYWKRDEQTDGRTEK